MTKYIIDDFFSSSGATLYKNSSDQSVHYYYLFRAKDPKNNASVLLRLFNDDFANKFEIQDDINKRQVIWFRAEVPVRQWNSMCLIRKFGQKFQIYQNNENVYSYGECRTVGPINDYYPTQVKDKPCHDKPKWYLNVSCKKRK